MAGIQAGGVGSGLDINGLVTQLVSAEGTPLSQRIVRHEVAVTTKVSALGSLKGALASFKSALDPLKALAQFQARKATSGNADYFTVAADSTAVAGHYDIEVRNLASAHQLASDPYLEGSDAEVGTGTLTLSVGSKSFSVQIGSDANTLADIRDAINGATDNTGVKATLLNGTEGTRLVLTSTRTGKDNAIEVSTTGGDGGLAVLTYDAGGVENMDQAQEAANAVAYVSGYRVESDTNLVEDAIDGVTITLKKAEIGKKVSLDVEFDASSVVARVQAFVTTYNTMQSTLTKLGSYNAETKAAGPLLGDSLLRGVEDQMRRGLTSPVSGLTGDYTTLASIGIKTTATGALELDATKLRSALDSNPNAVADLFASDNGVATRLSTELGDRLAVGSDLDLRNARLATELKDIAKDKEALTLRMSQIEARLRKQFTALDSLLSQMQTQSSFLSQQLSNLPGSSK